MFKHQKNAFNFGDNTLGEIPSTTDQSNNEGNGCTYLPHTFTFVCSEEACGISLTCNGGVVCDWEEAPMDEWEKME